jgi:hypothetical protein
MYKFLLSLFVFTQNLDQHPIRVVCGALAASGLAATLTLAIIDNFEGKKLWLKRAAFWFSIDIVPLVLFSVCIWPDQNEPSIFYKIFLRWPWDLFFVVAIAAFLRAIYCLTAYFGDKRVKIVFFPVLYLVAQAIITAFLKIKSFQ